ncbi:MAG: hypothetical protein ACRDN9_07205 [Streptosporangiaceae bacterium]
MHALAVELTAGPVAGLAAGVVAYVAASFAVLVLLGFYVSWRATRLDRLHQRVEAARAALDAALVRRSAVALELAASRLLDPATSLLLAGAAHDARAAAPEPRELAESDLSRALRAAFDQPETRTALTTRQGGAELLREFDAAARKTVIARRFYNDAVRDARALRGRRMARLLRLAGRAPVPPFFEIDDSPPATADPVDAA